MRFRHYFVAACLLFASSVRAQSAAEHIALGDRAYASLDALSAFNHYVEAIKIDNGNYEALWKAARSAIDRATYDESGETQAKYFAIAETYSRAAVAAKPDDAAGHFALARALGEGALSVGIRQRVRYATEVRAQALECLKADPKHAGCLHVMGVWNAEVMRLNGLARMVAKNILGGRVFSEASWADAKEYIDEAIANEPTRVVHYTDAAAIYRDVGNKAKARELYQTALRLPISDYNDRHYKAQAQAALKSL
jgi:tetratricopeptide (TPR) repeat protein